MHRSATRRVYLSSAGGRSRGCFCTLFGDDIDNDEVLFEVEVEVEVEVDREEVVSEEAVLLLGWNKLVLTTATVLCTCICGSRVWGRGRGGNGIYFRHSEWLSRQRVPTSVVYA